ncbi:hypothetical protein [Stenotrophobium rhamnosiphilum]|uniref:Capsule polysaccharide biosynthesis protein n=1 Tax=Stenotrophobium rhamnosiphilum TaxID=2029166 RepID=A0A2T5MIJ8_9GAMM|nr:hypothetical protein [Stenotrophobium rhamnosiphilum]PTU32369.1 hypothetical protein CJD38_06890 [Stenotrophobium rhamnosiphilum]
MKILFIENRQKTWFWELIAERLEQFGHQVAWLVQNPLFSPGGRNVYRIHFPSESELVATADPWFQPISASDRNTNYFAGNTTHYEYYRRKIAEVLSDWAPDLVIGEVALFHELITAHLCRDRGIRYVHPVAARYPAGRFFICDYDTQEVHCGSGDEMTAEDASALAELISTRSIVPFYMNMGGRLTRAKKALRLRLEQAKVLAGWCMGERYNTPSPQGKLALGAKVKANLASWDRLAALPPRGAKVILYPLQLQPEANIDVWGRPYRDQVGLIRRISELAGDGVVVAIKVNPKAKYEVCEELLKLSSPAITLLPKNTSMEDALNRCSGAITVSGTIGLEAVFGAARCFSLAHPIINSQFPEFAVASLNDAIDRILRSEEGGRGNAKLGANLISSMYRQSFPGMISDPVSYPEAIARQNLDLVAAALQQACLGGRTMLTAMQQDSSGGQENAL